jgi:hypothetical protein
VIPVLVSTADSGPNRVGVEVETPPSISTGTVAVTVKPIRTSLFDQGPTHIRLWLERADSEGGVVVAEPVELEVRAEVGELKPPVYLKEGVRISAGTGLLLRVIDTDDGREIAALPIRMTVDWE